MTEQAKIVLVGNPNVGKSALFNRLTKRYVTVSNYPGTTVSVTRGGVTIEDTPYEVIDTPGLYSLLPMTDDERVARKIIFNKEKKILVHVIDAKNIDRMLNMTLQLLETSPNVILVLNIIDEADSIGMKIDTDGISKELNIPVVKTVSIKGRGITELKERIHEFANA